MILLLPILLLFLLIILVKISKMMSRTVAVLVDFLFLGGFAAYSLHKSVSVTIASGYAIYFLGYFIFHRFLCSILHCFKLSSY